MKAHQTFTQKLLSICSVVIILSLVCSCTKDDPKPLNEPNLRTISVQEVEVVRSANNFSFDLFSRINGEHPDENLFISPFSISTALSMTLNGADGETLLSMKDALALDQLDITEINEGYKDLVELLLSMDNKVTLTVANSNWYTDQLTIHEAFKATLEEYYDAEVKATDFGDPATLDLINGWIEDKTNGKIKDMLDQIPSDVLMYLINAVYFKADWQYQFDKSETKDAPFYLDNETTIDVPMMYSEGVRINRFYTDSVLIADLPYGNGQFTFTVVLPQGDKNVDELADEMTASWFEAIASQMDTVTLPVYLPKFKIEYKKLLNDVLKDMGMEVAFSGSADFTNLFDEGVSAHISRVIHQSYLEVNEEGSEAAAATVVEIVETSGTGPVDMKINRPFLFFIREKHTNAILFAGKMVNPSL